MKLKILNLISIRTKVIVLIAALIVLGILGWLDVITDVRVRIGPLYITPVLFVAWFLGRRWGLLAAILSVTLWHGVGIWIQHKVGRAPLSLWDFASGLLGFSGIAVAVSWLRSLVDHEKALNRALQEALDQIKILEGMIPICAWCHKVRNDRGFWESIEAYVEARSNATWTHGICPECRQELLGQRAKVPIEERPP